jgi:tRNA(Arg) A34 adenosine deaminase TadA
MNNSFMTRAIALSVENVHNSTGGPFGAVIVYNNEIIAHGANSVTVTNDPTAHAEIVAIRAACQKLGTFKLTNCELYTSCEPCPMCLSAIYWARIAVVYYGNTKADAAAINFDDSFIYQQLSKPFEQRAIPMHQALRNEALTAFTLWQKKNEKISY